MTWILRGGGFLAMVLGLFLVFRPLSVLGDVVPFIGSLLGVGVGSWGPIFAARIGSKLLGSGQNFLDRI